MEMATVTEIFASTDAVEKKFITMYNEVNEIPSLLDFLHIPYFLN